MASKIIIQVNDRERDKYIHIIVFGWCLMTKGIVKWTGDENIRMRDTIKARTRKRSGHVFIKIISYHLNYLPYRRWTCTVVNRFTTLIY